MVSGNAARVLARCHGFRVKAGDEFVGAIATPVFAGRALVPEYLLIRLDHDSAPNRFRAVPTELVVSVDGTSETLTLAIDRDALTSLPQPERISSRPLPPPSPGPPLPRTDG
jgi:hypothetical protein